MIIVWIVLGTLGMVAYHGLWIWAIVDAFRVKDESRFRNGNRTAWVILILLTDGLAAIPYFAWGRPRSSKLAGHP